MSGLGPTNPSNREDRKEASKTYLEQTKLLIALSSAFIIAPAVIKDITYLNKTSFIWMEMLFVSSVLAGYVVVGTITGIQYNRNYNVYRLATRLSSFAQLGLYLAGLIIFIFNVSIKTINETSNKNLKEYSRNTCDTVYFVQKDTLMVKILKEKKKKSHKMKHITTVVKDTCDCSKIGKPIVP